MNNKELIESGMGIMQSFCEALQKAGRDICISSTKLKEMSAWELLALLSTNNIKFIYEERK